MTQKQEGLFYVKMFSLIDITTTGTIGQYRNIVKKNLLGETLDKEPVWKISRNKQRNFETVVQIIGLRAQPIYLENSVLLTDDLSNYNFGSIYTGTKNIWSLVFGVDKPDVYNSCGIQLYSLVEDFNDVPIICGLNESFSFKKSTFTSINDEKNVYFIPL
jgi:hypothetical protein